MVTAEPRSWSISFYPQTFLNCQRKTTVGLSFDFLLYNLLAFTCYAAFNCEGWAFLCVIPICNACGGSGRSDGGGGAVVTSGSRLGASPAVSQRFSECLGGRRSKPPS